VEARFLSWEEAVPFAAAVIWSAAARRRFHLAAEPPRKQHFLDTDAKLDLVRDTLFAVADEFGWQLQAWAILGIA